MQKVTKDQVEWALKVMVAVGRTIQELGQVPAGHLYAQLMDKMSMESFQQIILNLENAKLIHYGDNHLITWIGPHVKNGEVDGRV